MRRHYYIIGAIVLFGLLGAVLIVATTPSRSADSVLPAAATPDTSTSLKGGNIEGKLVFSRNGALWAWRGDTATRLNIDPGKSIVANTVVRLIHPALSRDGSKLAYVRQDETFSDVWVAGADGSTPRALSNNRGSGTPRSPNFLSGSYWAFQPVWSPNGTEIAFLGDYGSDDLALWASDATRFNRRAVSREFALGGGGIQRSGWSPQGDMLVIAATRNGKSQIYTIKPTNGTPVALTEHPEGVYDPAYSPDGKFIAYVTRRGNSGELWLMRADGSNPVVLTNGAARQPVWSPDGKKVAYLGLKDGAFEIFTLEVAPDGTAPVGGPRQLTTGARLDGTDGLSWSR